jgi:hypothetical protein
MIRNHRAALLTAVKVEKRSKQVPGSDPWSQRVLFQGVFIYLFVLIREDCWLVPDVGPGSPELWIMPSKNAGNRGYALTCVHDSA